MRQHNLLEADVNLDFLAENTVNYTGAEIEAVIKCATSYALFKEVSLSEAGQSNK